MLDPLKMSSNIDLEILISINIITKPCLIKRVKIIALSKERIPKVCDCVKPVWKLDLS